MGQVLYNWGQSLNLDKVSWQRNWTGWHEGQLDAYCTWTGITCRNGQFKIELLRQGLTGQHLDCCNVQVCSVP